MAFKVNRGYKRMAKGLKLMLDTYMGGGLHGIKY